MGRKALYGEKPPKGPGRKTRKQPEPNFVGIRGPLGVKGKRTPETFRYCSCLVWNKCVDAKTIFRTPKLSESQPKKVKFDEKLAFDQGSDNDEDESDQDSIASDEKGEEENESSDGGDRYKELVSAPSILSSYSD